MTGGLPIVGRGGRLPNSGRCGRLPFVGRCGRLPCIGRIGRLPSVGRGGRLPSVGRGGRLPSVGRGGRLPSVGRWGRLPSVGRWGGLPFVGEMGLGMWLGARLDQRDGIDLAGWVGCLLWAGCYSAEMRRPAIRSTAHPHESYRSVENIILWNISAIFVQVSGIMNTKPDALILKQIYITMY